MNEPSPVSVAALLTALGAVGAAAVSRWKPPRRLAELVDDRTRWLVDELQGQVRQANADAAAARAHAIECERELAVVRATIRRLEARIAQVERDGR